MVLTAITAFSAPNRPVPSTVLKPLTGWASSVHSVKLRHRKRLEHLSPAEQEDALCEMNVIEQVGNVAWTNVLQDAWARGQNVTVHGWCYGLKDGLVKDLGVSMSRPGEVMSTFRNALKRYPRQDA